MKLVWTAIIDFFRSMRDFHTCGINKLFSSGFKRTYTHVKSKSQSNITFETKKFFDGENSAFPTIYHALVNIFATRVTVLYRIHKLKQKVGVVYLIWIQHGRKCCKWDCDTLQFHGSVDEMILKMDLMQGVKIRVESEICGTYTDSSTLMISVVFFFMNVTILFVKQKREFKEFKLFSAWL